jgi:hypothetical protein
LVLEIRAQLQQQAILFTQLRLLDIGSNSR